MKLSFDWLSDYVDLSGLSPEEVAEKLTMGAFEVEEIKRVGPDIQGDVVVGEILDIRQHPDAQKIRLTTIRISEKEEPRQIVCGAWNIEVGHRIPVALPGAKVINRHDGTALDIKESKIRGELSRGMLCSAPELGIEGSGDGILLLDPTTPVGTNAKELLHLQQDTVFYVAPRSNRGDALSVVGMARELAAILGRPLKQPQWKLPAETASSSKFDLAIADTDDCPFFTIRMLTDVKVGPSPDWMVRRLEAVGMRSVNNIVDITNYVMQELGQPLHAYDVAHLNGTFLQTRRAAKGEKLITIDDRERELNEEILAIADRQNPVGVAGVMGGKGSEITDATTVVALEAASFNSARVRRSSRLLGLSSDSSLRFERGVDLASVRLASDRAAYLLVEHCGAKLGALSVAGSDSVHPLMVPLRLHQITRLCDIEVDAAKVEALLSPLGFRIKREAGQDRFDQPELEIEVPSYRLRDVTREVDVIEEVVRLYGYDNVPQSMPQRTVSPPVGDRYPRMIKAALSAAGLNETWTSSLVALSDLNGRGCVKAGEAPAVKVLNPLSEEHQALRQSLLPGLFKATAYNHDRNALNVWLFEMGLTYHRNAAVKTNKYDTGTDEVLNVAAIITGDNELSGWPATGNRKNSGATSKDSEALEFFTLKGIAENLFERLSINKSNIQYAAEEASGWFHPTRSCKVLYKPAGRDKHEPKLLGWLGEAHPAVVEAYGLKSPACIFELNVGNLRNSSSQPLFVEIPPTPPVVRDITADVSKQTEQAALMQCITQVGGKLLRQVEIVSVYDLSDETKSLSYRLTFQHPEQTLTADQVEEIMTKIRNQLTRQLSATFRV